MSETTYIPSKDELELFKELVAENRYDFCKLIYIIFPFGVKGHALEFQKPYDWQMQELSKLSKHLSDPATRYQTYKLCVSSGNGAAKTAFGAMTNIMLMYTQRLKARVTANTQPQMRTVIWPEYDLWFRHARYSDHFFEKLGEVIKARDEKLGNIWRIDSFTWNESAPSATSGLHNKGFAISYTFEEAPGIPAIIWNYALGAYTDVDTIKIWMAFGNSDDPESAFEQAMLSPDWHTRRIDTRTLSHIDKKEIATLLSNCGGNEDHDDFRVRVRGLPRKTAKDAVMSVESVQEAFKRGDVFDAGSVGRLPLILTCDPAWTGGDYTCIWYRQGNYARMLEMYHLDKTRGEDHMKTYVKLCEWENELKADYVFIDQGEGTTLKTLANADGKNWELFAFNQAANDALEFKDSQYHNIRAQMYYEGNTWLLEGGALSVRMSEWREIVIKQLCWTKGGRHKQSLKKLCEPKEDIRVRVGASPDTADGFVLGFARRVMERKEENQDFGLGARDIGGKTYQMPLHSPAYENIVDGDYQDLYKT